MFVTLRVDGIVTPGTLQPAQLRITGSWECGGAPAGGETVELQLNSPAGAPAGTFTATSSTGAPGTPPLGSVTFTIPAWTQSVCGMKLGYLVRGTCSGAMQPWQSLSRDIDCGDCPRIQLAAPTYAPCTGANPALKPTTLAATVMLRPNRSSTFQWDFGDGNSQSVPSITNSSGDWNQPFQISTTHNYVDSAAQLQACLRPQNGECPSVCVTIDPSCGGPGGCPVATVAVSNGPCDANGAVPVTYTVTFTPPIPQGVPASVTINYGGANTQGLLSATITPNTAAGPVSSLSHATSLVHRAGGYSSSANVTAFVNGQLCTSNPNVLAAPQPCIGCPDPQNPITVTVTVPNDPRWCAAVTAPIGATLAAQVNWAAPVPANPPIPVRFDWTVTLPNNAGTATQSTTMAAVSTTAGWIGTGATGAGGAPGAVNLSQAGTYSVSVTAVFAPNSGLPTDASGTITCNTTAPATFRLDPCDTRRDCPRVTDLQANPPCISGNTPSRVAVTATVDDPAGTAGTTDWNFDDPGSQGNQISTATPTASHDYAVPGTYTVTARLRSTDPGCPNPASVFSRPITVVRCPDPPTTTPPPPPTSDPCAALLWAAIICMALGGVLVVLGCVLSTAVPQASVVLMAVGIGLTVLGWLLLFIWWLVCRPITACSVILAVRAFVIAMIAVFAVIAIVLAILAAFGVGNLWPCAGAATVYGLNWGIVLAIIDGVALARGCLVANPSGGAGSSSSPLTGNASKKSAHGTLRMVIPGLPIAGTVGLGTALSRVTSLAGITPCEPCRQRAARLDERVQISGRR
ncbi:MAG: PKD domain-containing protein [Betaproteobacteria bacterium]|jgi:hypothetical protein